MERFEERVLAACKELLAPGDRVIAAVSGGADSMALLQFLLEYKDALGVGVEAVHVDHRMRADSARDAAFVAEFCKKNGVPLHAFAAAAPPARPSEEWCRELRYGFFETLAGPGVKIATAHTLSDQAETLLLRLARGAGVRGAAGIPAVRGCYVRPMLGVAKAEAEDFCRRRGLAWVTDESNFSDDYARNRLRRHAMPAIEAACPGAGRLDGGHRVAAQPVAGVVVGKIALVGDPGEPPAAAEVLRLGLGDAQHGPHVAPPHGGDARRPPHPGPPGKAQKQRLGLVGEGVGGGDLHAGARQRLEKAVAELAAPLLAGAGRRRGGGKGVKGHAVLFAELRHEGGVPGGIRAHAVVHMNRLHPNAQSVFIFQQKLQQGHGVGPAGDRRNDPVAGRQQLFAGCQHPFLKSFHGYNPHS